MMASNILSKLLPSNNMAPSIYEDLRAHDEASEPSDLEERAGLVLDEENLGGAFHDYDLDRADAFDGEDSRVTTESTAFLHQHESRLPTQTKDKHRNVKDSSKPNWMAQSPRILEDDGDGDDDVPASLLIEGDNVAGPSDVLQQRSARQQRATKPRSVPGPSTNDTRSPWDAAQAHQKLHQEDNFGQLPSAVPKRVLLTGSPRDKALWTWLNATNLDHFMGEVYDYYIGAGIWCICLQRILSLLTIAFVAAFTTFLTQCIQYDLLPHSKQMSEILVEQCTTKMSGAWNFGIWLLAIYLIWKFCAYLNDMRRLKRMHDFYLHLLNVPDSDMQTVSWQDIVARIMALRDANPLTAEKLSPALKRYMGSQSKERLDAHDIANRLMRRENYLIALFNKEVLDLTLPIPFFRNRQIFSQTVEWNLNYCILDLVFNEHGQVRQLVLKDTHRRQLSNALRSRFMFAGFMNVICAPVAIIYLLIYYFFKYFNEYQKNPSAIGSRQYTPLAKWKFREFNELPHLFEKRINMSYPFASRYVEQFPKIKMVHIFRFISFVAGAIVSVLALASVFDPDLFLGFEITSERTVIFYLGVFGTIWAVAHGAIPEENMVFDPEYALRNVIEYTHYMPSQWKDRLHSDEVKKEFSELYQMKIVIFLEEVLSIIFTPFVLWLSLPQCSDRIIDFFREFTIHVDGLGYVCSFAVFDFKKGIGNMLQQGPGNTGEGLRDDYYSTKHGKMAASYYGFLDNYVTNPKTGIPGHVPPGIRPQFHPPPAFPGLMSPTLAADMAASRMGRSERPRSRAPAGSNLPTARTPRFPPSAAHASPMPSMLLDPHHQPSTSGFGGGRSIHNRRNSRSRYLPSRNIIEDPIEDEEEEEAAVVDRRAAGDSSGPENSGLDESRWETSPTRTTSKMTEDEESASGNAGGVLGLLYQFHQKAQSDGRAPGVHI